MRNPRIVIGCFLIVLTIGMMALAWGQPTLRDAPRSSLQPGFEGEATGGNSQYIYIRVTLQQVDLSIEYWDTTLPSGEKASWWLGGYGRRDSVLDSAAVMEWGSYVIHRKPFWVRNLGAEPLDLFLAMEDRAQAVFGSRGNDFYLDGDSLWRPDVITDPTIHRNSLYQSRAIVTNDSFLVFNLGAPPSAELFRLNANVVPRKPADPDTFASHFKEVTDTTFFQPEIRSNPEHISRSGISLAQDESVAVWLEILGPSSDSLGGNPFPDPNARRMTKFWIGYSPH